MKYRKAAFLNLLVATVAIFAAGGLQRRLLLLTWIQVPAA